MTDNLSQWDDWLKAEDIISNKKDNWDLFFEGVKHYKQADYSVAASLFCQAAELAEEIGDISAQCTCLLWEGYCYTLIGQLKKALTRLLLAEELGGGDEGVRFHIVSELYDLASLLPLPKTQQEELLQKLTPYKSSMQFGGSKSIVLRWERQLLLHRGNQEKALGLAQEAFVCQGIDDPAYHDCYYYQDLVDSYCENGLFAEGWNTLREWKIHGSTTFAKVKSWQFRSEAQLLYKEAQLIAAWDAILLCQAEERYLNIYGKVIETLTWLIRIGVDAGRMDEVRASLPLLFRWHNGDSLYDQFECFYWFAYYYTNLSWHLQEDGDALQRNTLKTACVRAERWYRRAKRVGLKLDKLLETDMKQKELDKLRKKLLPA